MAQVSEPLYPDDFEPQGSCHVSRRSGERKDSDTAALRHAGKSPVLKNLIQVVRSDYEPKLWHGSLLCYAVLLVCIFVKTVAATKPPRIESVLLVAYLLRFIGVLVPLVYLAPHGSAQDVFVTFLNDGGWGSQGLSFFVGITGNAFAFPGKLYLLEAYFARANEV
ncbi:MAG: hypothetical protein Q9188_000002 [Gyalolechia gomerana]